LYCDYGSGRLSDEERRMTRSERIVASEKTVSFVLSNRNGVYYGASRYGFHNFYKKDNRWNELTINDLLFVQGEKRVLLNDLLIQKVRALKGVDIDCSNTAGFIDAVENRFILTPEGVDFNFWVEKGRDTFVPVSFTWAELQPFLKMRF
jgi:hypothetical protein